MIIYENVFHKTQPDDCFWELHVEHSILATPIKLYSFYNPDQQKRYANFFNVNFEDISHLFLVFLLVTLSKYLFAGNMLNMFKVNNKGTRMTSMDT